MKQTKILYWTFTGIFAAFFIFSAFLYLSKNPALTENFKNLGFTGFFIPMLGIAKLLGALSILNPWFPKLREWAYAGFTFTLIGAIWLHAVTSTSFIMPLVFLVLLAASYFFNNKLNRFQTSNLVTDNKRL